MELGGDQTAEEDSYGKVDVEGIVGAGLKERR
jgi:hypothetical protein